MTEVMNLSSYIGQLDEAEWKTRQSQMDENLKAIINDTSEKIEGVVNQNFNDLMTEVNEFSSKDALVQYERSLDEKINSPEISIEEKRSLNAISALFTTLTSVERQLCWWPAAKCTGLTLNANAFMQ